MGIKKINLPDKNIIFKTIEIFQTIVVFFISKKKKNKKRFQIALVIIFITSVICGNFLGDVERAQAVTVIFNYTGGQQTWVVPAGVTSVSVDARGASGGVGAGWGGSPGGGGYGGRTQATITVTPGETLYIYVGGLGGTPTAGYNGGGAGWDIYCGSGGGGGGASDVRKGGLVLGNRVIVAAGGAGGGGSVESDGIYNGGNGGAGGGTSGTAGSNSYGTWCPYYCGTGGGGGTSSVGGYAGWNAYYGEYATAGSSGQGGAGMILYSCGGGGGGGGGYYGGGGGGGNGGGGGGGGSSWTSGSSPSYTTGYNSGNGRIIFTYTTDTTPPTVSATGASSSWYTTNPTITLSTADTGGSGLSYSKYSWNTNDAICRSSGTPFTNGNTINIVSQGTHILYLCNADGAGNTGSWNGTYKLDSGEPVSGSVTNANGFINSTTINVYVVPGTDATSGMSPTNSDYYLEAATATLTGTNCNSFGSYADANVSETASASSYLYTGSTGNCYKFRYTVKDVAGNSTIYTGSDITKIDTGLPDNTQAVKGQGTVKFRGNVRLK